MSTRQAPIHSGFGSRTTAQEALAGQDLSGKIAIVTGGYSGLGLETTRVLAEAGATVIVPARRLDHARSVLKNIPRTEVASLDLLDPVSIDAFARNFIASKRPLHILVNSAGIMATPLQRDARGYESQFAANHLGHFQLVAGLWPALREASGARVVSVSSRGHRIDGVHFDDPHFERREYHKWKAYGQSKSANVLFAVTLDARGQAHGVRAFALHPGNIPTDLSRHLSDEEMRAAGFRDEHGNIPADKVHLYKTVEQGAATSVWCATSKQLDGMGGVYCEDVDIAEAVAADAKQDPGVRPWAIDPALGERLWGLSETLTGTKFTI
ncbi:MAG: oxidoreductase [Janthinobacterium lividum]